MSLLRINLGHGVTLRFLIKYTLNAQLREQIKVLDLKFFLRHVGTRDLVKRIIFYYTDILFRLKIIKCLIL